MNNKNNHLIEIIEINLDCSNDYYFQLFFSYSKYSKDHNFNNG